VPDVLLSGDHAKIAAWRDWEGTRLAARRDGLPDPVPEPPRRKRRRSARPAAPEHVAGDDRAVPEPE
jgi:tRNA G37 N-methylase TrmD